MAFVRARLYRSTVAAIRSRDDLLSIHAAPVDTFRTMADYASQPRTQVLIVNSAITYYFAAVAVAIGFRMNLFNIGVDGQYRLAAMIAASVGGAISLPAPP